MKRLSSHVFSALVVISVSAPALQGADDEAADLSAAENGAADSGETSGCTSCSGRRFRRFGLPAIRGCANCAGGRLSAVGGCASCGGRLSATGGCANCGGGQYGGVRGYLQALNGYVHNAAHDPVHPFPWYAHSDYGRYASVYHYWNMQQAAQIPWHGAYRHTEWGAPVALVVPPTSDNQTIWSWGVGQTRMVPLYHQFRRGVPAAVSADGTVSENGVNFLPTPTWPSNTEQFGVYPVRGPW